MLVQFTGRWHTDDHDSSYMVNSTYQSKECQMLITQKPTSQNMHLVIFWKVE